MIAIVCHDAGGAEILSSYVLHHRLKCVYALAGPAVRIFERKLGAPPVLDLQEALDRAESLLCGTSWQSNLEVDAIRAARASGKRSVAFIDHWVNYRERFTRNAQYCLPDEIWVGDIPAFELARREFPGISIQHVENPYLRDIGKSLELEAEKVTRQRLSTGLAVLYVCEPISEHALLRFGDERYWGYTEWDALDYFLSNINVLGSQVEQIILRPHPSENAKKYNDFVATSQLSILIRNNRSLSAEVAGSDVVVGCNSMAMVVGLLGGKRVICAIPPEGKGFALPHREIESLQQLVRKFGGKPT